MDYKKITANDIKNCSITPSREKFEKEFEDEIIINCDNYGHEEVTLDNRIFEKLIRSCFSMGEFDFRAKVKIFCKKGKIVIEKLEE